MTIEEILAGESKNVEFKENLPEKSIKSFSELPIKPERLLALTRKRYSRKWMPLQMLYQTAVNRRSSRILLYKRLMARLLLW